MKLYEIVNGYIGESYVRCYAWAESTEQALTLARAQYEAHADYHKDPTYWERLEVTELFDASAAPFATPPNDHGWPEPKGTTT